MPQTANNQNTRAAWQTDGAIIQQVTDFASENPEWFDSVLESLAGVLIDIAEKDGTIKPVEWRTSGRRAA